MTLKIVWFTLTCWYKIAFKSCYSESQLPEILIEILELMMNYKFTITVLLLLLIVLISADVMSAEKKSVSLEHQGTCQRISRADAISQARNRVKGKVVGVQFNKRGNRSVYQVRMLVGKNRVKSVSIPACR